MTTATDRSLEAATVVRSLEATFLEKLRQWRIRPICEVKGNDHVCLRPFIRVALLKEWMKQEEAGFTQTNGKRLFQEIPSLEVSPRVSTTAILDKSPIVFGWLIKSGHSRLIQHFHDVGIEDAKLRDSTYLLDKIKVLEDDVAHYLAGKNSDFEGLLRDLEETRWQFCPHHLESYLDDVSFGNNSYLPFCQHQNVAENGATADVYIAYIQEEFVSEDMKQYLGPSVELKTIKKVRAIYSNEVVRATDLAQCYKLAIKEMIGNRLTTYSQERRALRGIRNKQGMLRCLGFYNCLDKNDPPKTHYSILLEFAETNLHDFFQNEDTPQLAEEIISQWEKFCHIAQAIETLHGFEYDGARWLGFVSTLGSV